MTLPEWATFLRIFFIVLSVMGASIFLIFLLKKIGAQFTFIHFVPQSKEYVVEHLGKYSRTLGPGLKFTIPLLERISNKVDMREQVMDVPSQEVITKDNASIRVDGIVFYKVSGEESAAKATYQVSDLRKAIEQLTFTNIRSVMGSMDLDDLLSKRDDINDKLFKVVHEATDPWGIKITRIEIKDIKPPDDLVEAMSKQMKAEREKRASILEADGQREAAIRQATGEKEAEVLKAQGYKEAEVLKAQALKEIELIKSEWQKTVAFDEAVIKERLAKAEAEAIAVVSKAITKGDIQAVNYFIAQKYVEALHNIGSANNQKLVLLPIEATNMIGSIAGIGDIAKEILTKKNSDLMPDSPTQEKITNTEEKH